MEEKEIKISLSNYKKLKKIGKDDESFDDIISKLISSHEDYNMIMKIIEVLETNDSDDDDNVSISNGFKFAPNN